MLKIIVANAAIFSMVANSAISYRHGKHRQWKHKRRGNDGERDTGTYRMAVWNTQVEREWHREKHGRRENGSDGNTGAEKKDWERNTDVERMS